MRIFIEDLFTGTDGAKYFSSKQFFVFVSFSLKDYFFKRENAFLVHSE